MKKINLLAKLASLFLVVGCATQPPAYDYTAFKQSRPKSILVLPPVNNSVEVGASYSFYSLVSRPLGEAGYYVFPVAVVDEMFKQNGYTSPNDIQSISQKKLNEIFGADAALYVKITDFGTKFMVLSSSTVVTAEATLVDLRSGVTLWKGTATASSAERQNAGNAGLAGLLIQAIANQIASNLVDQGHDVAGLTSARLLSPNVQNGVLFGPRSPSYMNDGKPMK